MTDLVREDLARIDAAFLVLIDDIFHDGKPVGERVEIIEEVYRPFMDLVRSLGYTRTEILMEACLKYVEAVR